MGDHVTLVEALTSGPVGLCGAHDPAASIQVIADLERRLCALTLGAILDAFPLPKRWQSLAALADHWLLNPSDVAYRHSKEVSAAFEQKDIHGPHHNARVWWQVCRGIQGRFEGKLRAFLDASSDDAFKILAYLQKGTTTFPVLSGPVISVRWLDLVHRYGMVPLANWENLSVALSTIQAEAAASFNLPTRAAHPVTAQALAVWARNCNTLEPPQCDLTTCPRRSPSHE